MSIQIAPDHIEESVFSFLTAKYVQRADDRQKAMGLQYTEAETHDLAKEVSRLFTPAVEAHQEVEDLTCLLDSLNAPTHDGDPAHDCEAPALSLAGRVAALAARMRPAVWGAMADIVAVLRNEVERRPHHVADAREELEAAIELKDRDHLVRAAALIVAEIERLDRAAALSTLAARDGELLP